MANIKTFVSCMFGPRLHAFYRLTGHTLSSRSPQVFSRSHVHTPNGLQSISDLSKMDRQAEESFLQTLEPALKRSFNLAAYVNQSDVLQKLITQGVSLFDIENIDSGAAREILKLNFEKDCLPYMQFLVDSGLKKRNLGRFISEYPRIFFEELDDLVVRVKYLKSRGFSNAMIAKALNRSSHIISHPTKCMDHNIAELQVCFKLHSTCVRSIIVHHPQVLSMPKEQFITVKFVVCEEFGFKDLEIAQILEAQPEIFGYNRFSLVERLELIHNTIGLSHADIVKWPKIITSPIIELRHRHMYLEKLKRNQYNPKEPLYVPPRALYGSSDEEFCVKYAKTSLGDYKLFLKSR